MKIPHTIKRLFLFAALMIVGALPARANQAVRGWCESGAQPVVLSGLTSTTQVQASYPLCQVSVFVHGGGLATIFSDNSGTPLANPFTAQTGGQWMFYAANGHYDVTLSGAGMSSPVTYSDILLSDPANQSAAIPCSTLSFTATPAFLATNNICYQMTLTGNITSSTITGTPANGNLLAFSFVQDATGGRTIAFPTNFVIPTVFSLDLAPLHPNYLTFKFDGTNWTFLTNSGSGSGGANPAPPLNSLQKSNVSTLAASSITDDGTTVKIGEEVAFSGPRPYFDLSQYGGSTSNNFTTAACTNGSPNISLVSAIDFVNGQGIVVHQCGAATALSTPSAPTVTSTVTGSTTYNYCAVAEDRSGGLTPCGAVGTTTTGPATLAKLGTSIALTQVVNSSGVATYTCAATCNLTNDSPVVITGFSNLSNGTRVITSLPSGTTFTTYTADADGTTITAGAAQPFSANVLNFPASSYSGNGTLRYWIYKNNVLSGVAVGLDPYYVDYGQGIGFNNPGYIPSTPPVAAQNGDLAAIITSGAGTTNLTLSKSAGATTSGQGAGHDNSAPLLNLMQSAAYNSPAAIGPSIYIPAGTVFNSTTDMINGISTGGFVSVRLLIGGTITLGQPWIMRSGVRVEGSQAATTNNSFQNDSSARIIQNSHPAFYITPIGQSGAGGFNYSNLLFVAPNITNPYTAIYSDLNSAGGGINGIVLTNINAAQRGASVVILKGAFGDVIKGGTLTGDFFVPGIRLTNSSSAVTGGNNSQTPGNTLIDGTFFAATGVQIDCIPNPTFCVSGAAILKNSLMENQAGPLMAYYQTAAQIGFGVNIENSQVADPQVGGGTPLLDAGRNVALGVVFLKQDFFGQTLFLGGTGNVLTGASTTIVDENSTGAVGNIPLSARGASETVNFNYSNIATGTGRFLYAMNTPAAPVSAVVSAGGSVPVDTYSYRITAFDIDGFESLGGASITNVVVTPGNQTVTVTRPTLPDGANTWTIIRVNHLGNGARVICNPAPASQLTQVDTFAVLCGQSVPNVSFAANAALSSSGIYAPIIRLASGGFSLTTNFPSPLTANRTIKFQDATGTVPYLEQAQTWSATQTLTNASQLRFLSANGTNYAGFQGGASTVNLVWLLPSTDSTGTQCLSSNGSQQFAWSPCSGGTGTPGGANTNVQYNNSASFGGSANFTFDGTGLVGIGLANTTLGKLKLFGSTSGDVTLQPQAVAGTATILTAPNTSGTLANGATTPLVLSATTGNLTCPTCVTSAASLTANQLLIGAGSQASAGLGTLGTTTTVLHGNAGGAPTFGAVSLTADITGILGIANGGTGQSTATTAFNALSPITSVGDLIVGNGVNTATRLAIGTNGLCLVSNGSTATWNSCATGAVSGTAVAAQGTFWSASSALAGSANWTYAASSGHSVTQGANAADAFFMKRATDTTPTGNYLHFRDAANANDIFKVDVSGNVTAAGGLSSTSTTIAGTITLNQGVAPALVANNIELIAPTAVSATGEQFAFPGTPSTGFIRWTNVSNVLTGAFAPAAGIGACVNTVVTANNDNTPPTCNQLTGLMFGAQAANTAFMAPNGSSGTPTFRALVSGDIPPINLNLGGNGGITNTLPIANGGTNATSASNAFNNLSPMTTAGDLIYGGASGIGTRLAAGTATQLLHGGTTPSWSAVSLTADVSGVLPFANGGTNASSGLSNTNGAIYSDGTKLVATATGGAGTLCLVSTNGAAPSFGSCSGSAGASWSALTAPSGDLSLAMSTFNTLFTHGIMTGTRNIMEWTDGASTSTGSVINVHTNASSTMKPFTFTAAGTANGIQMSNVGAVTAIGTGGITATSTTLSISTSAPLGGGGAFNTNLTLNCATCVTSGSSLTNNQLVAGSGGGQGTASANLSGDVTTSGGLATTIAANAVTSAKMAAVNTRRTCTIVIGADNGAALANADIAPQLQQCQINAASTVFEIDVRADGGTPNVVAAVRHCTVGACTVGANETVSDLTSSALATGTAGAAACSKTGATAGLDTFTTCSATLQNTSLAVGDYIETHTATAGGTAKRMSIEVHYTVN